METYADALLVAIPLFTLLILVEAAYGALRGRVTLNSMDTISSLSSGMTNVVKDSLGLVVVLISYPFLLEHLRLLEIEATWLLYVVAFLAIDFAGYWSHRLNHSVNYFWNHHIIHHSSEEFNLPCALRQSVSNVVGIYGLFLLPAALLGVPAHVINVIAPIHLFLQFWYHTRHIPKLGWLEYLIITPSQHRVHHAINPEYLDKNLGQIFPWWDRLFGTFQEELDDVPPVYGVTRPVSTWNPFRINFQHLWLLLTDAVRTRSWRDKARLWFMPTGWRPADVAQRFPARKIDDPYDFEKYRSDASVGLVGWSWFQFLSALALLMFLLASFRRLEGVEILGYGLFIFVTVFGYTELMDRSRLGSWMEVLRGLGGLGYLAFEGSWFGLGTLLPGGDVLIAAYFTATAIGGFAFGLPRYATPRASGAATGA